jgi:tetratricopeptide (TPR) repeat protein
MTVDEALQSAIDLQRAGKSGQAEAVYRRILDAHPDHAQSLHALGALCLQMGRTPDAVELFRRVAALHPGMPEAHNNFGGALIEQKLFEMSIPSLETAIKLRPDYAAAHCNLGNALLGMGRLDESEAAFRRNLELQPDSPEARNGLANVLYLRAETDRAIEMYQAAITLRPEYAKAHWNLGLALLMKGDLARGWPEYEWRWRMQDYIFRRNLNRPMWDGSDLAGRRILLHAEQGFGDTIQFARYMPMVADRGGKIVLACQRELQRLLQTAAPIEACVAPGEPLPPHDVQCGLLSLPYVFKTTLANVPNRTPYLRTEKGTWPSRLADERRLKIGLAWYGRPYPPGRSIPLEMFEPLGRVAGTRLISLQKGDAAKDVQSAPATLQLTDWSADLHDIADTAALIETLDLVITIDTAVAHLAGALGKPVWVLLKSVPDWRWLLAGDRTPWYPSMRLFRQNRPGDWPEPINEVARALETLL